MATTIKSKLNSILKSKKQTLISILILFFVSFSIIFPAGYFHSTAKLEETSEYLAEVAKNHTTNGKYVAMMVEPKEVGSNKINDPYNDFLYLYGTFREGLATYIGAANADKSHSVQFKELNKDINFSFLNVDRGFGVEEYHEDDEGNMIYRAAFYPLNLMFYSNHPNIPGQYSFLYISKSRATDLLDVRGLDHTRENYHNLLNQLIDIEIDGKEYKFAIDNIYLEDNYFFEAIYEVMGDFFLAGTRYPDNVKRQGVYFLRQYPYQNKYYIQYATSLYSVDDYDFEILKYNFNDDYELDYNRLIFAPSTKGDVVSYVFVVLAILMMLLAFVVIVIGNFDFSILSTLLVAISILLPYVIFWASHLLTKSALFFSNFSTNFVMWIIVIMSVIYFILFLVSRTKKRITNESTH